MILRKEKREGTDERIILKLENDIESTSDESAVQMEHFWSSVNGLQSKRERPVFTLEVLSDSKGAAFYLSLPKRYKTIICKKLNAVYPYIEIKEVEDDPLGTMGIQNEYVYGCELRLTYDHSFAIKTSGAHKTFLNNLLNTMNHFNENDVSLVQIVVKPLPESWSARAAMRSIRIRSQYPNRNSLLFKSLMIVLDILIGSLGAIIDTLFTHDKLRKSFSDDRLRVPQTDGKGKERRDKFSKPCFNVSIRVATASNDRFVAERTAKSIAEVFRELDDENSLRPITIKFDVIRNRELTNVKNNAFSTLELSQFGHLPSRNVKADNVTHTSVKMPYDKGVPSKGITFGSCPQQKDKPVAFPMIPISPQGYLNGGFVREIEKIVDNVCKPRLVLGQMGTGKSEWIVNYALNLIRMGISVILVDPKNDTQKRLIESIPDDRLHLIDYLNLGDLVYPPALNLLRRRTPGDQTEVSLIVQSLINFFKKEFGRSWGFAMQQLIMMTGNAILLDDVATMYEFQLMLTNAEYRSRIINKIETTLKTTNGGKALLKELLSFWRQFHGLSEAEQMKRISSTMNKVGVFMANRIVRAIVSQRESYDFRAAADKGRIVIVNIPDGELGDENTRLLASFINKAIWLDFRTRVNVPLEKRYPTVWLIEEAHMVMDEEFVPILTQSRGYRLGVTILTQGLTNFDNRGMGELRDLILTNCKNKIVFRVGPQDARILQEEFAPLTAFDLMNCPDYHFYSKILLDDGRVSNVFFARSLPVAPVLRSYDKYRENHRSGRLTIDQIEEQLDERHALSADGSVMIPVINMGGDDHDWNDTLPPRKKRRSQLQFLEN